MTRRTAMTICFPLLAANLAFIWCHSMQTAAVSSELSLSLLGKLGWMISLFGSLAEFVLRKLAHFSEFASLGFLMAWAAHLMGERRLHRLTTPLLFGVLAACVDETIQIFVEGRDSSLRDVWIDTAGVLTGILVLLMLALLITRKRKR